MPIKILTPARVDSVTTHNLVFEYVDHPESRSGGASFDCDADGRVRVNALMPAGRATYQECMRGEMRCLVGATYLPENDYLPTPGTGKIVMVRVTPGTIERTVRRHKTPAIGQCRCGRRVVLADFTNACRCGRAYNSAGSELASVEQWGEETGEHPADLARI